MMTKCCKVICAITFALLLATPVLAQKTLWNNYNEAGIKAFNACRYAEAERFFKESLEAAKMAGDNGYRLERSLNNLGNVYKEQARYDEADKLFRAAVAISESDMLAKQDLPMTIQNVGTLAATRGNYFEAIELYKQALQLAEKQFGKQNVARPANNLISIYIKNGNYVEAAQLMLKIKGLFRTSKQQESLDCAYLIYLSGELAKERGQLPEAEQQYKTAINIANKVLGPEHKYVAGGHQSLGDLYVLQGRFDDGEKELKEGLRITEKASSPDSPETGLALSMLAQCYVEQGKYADAEPLCQRGLKNIEKALGANNANSADLLCVLARIREQKGEYEEAENLLTNALKLTEDACGSQSVKTRKILQQLGECYYDQGKYPQAQETLTRALAIADDARSKKTHPQIAKIRISLGRVFVKENKLDEAQKLYEQALADTEAIFGKDTIQYSDGERELAALQIQQRNYGAAEAAYKHVLAIDEEHSKTASCAAKLSADYDALSRIYSEQNNQGLAQQMTQKAQELKKNLPGSRFLAQMEQSAAATAGDATRIADKPVADKWALVVGISNFKDPSINLKYATKDAVDFRNFLVNSAHFQSDHVKLLTDAEATRENIIGQLGDKWLGRLANRDDLIVIYISSHGSSAQETAGGVNFLVAHDTRKESLLATGIPMQWLTSILKDQIHSDRIVLIMDVCHGAAAATESKGLTRTNGVDVDGLTLGKGQAVLCSSLADQLSWESKNYQNSVFTRKLIEALSQNGEKTTLQTAYKYLRDNVESEVLRDRGQLQTPVLNEKLWAGTDAMLSIKPSSPRPGLK